MFPHQFRIVVGLLCLIALSVIGGGFYLAHLIYETEISASIAAENADQAKASADEAKDNADEAYQRADAAATKLGE